MRSRYEVMGNALNATGRPILYSLCNWGEDYPWNWGSTIANSWRISGDVYDSWDQPDSRCPWYVFLAVVYFQAWDLTSAVTDPMHGIAASQDSIAQ